MAAAAANMSLKIEDVNLDGITSVHFIRGGLQSEREEKSSQFAKFGLRHIANFGNEVAICEYWDHRLEKKMETIMKAFKDSIDIEHPLLSVVDLPTHIKPELTKYSVRDGIMRVHLLAGAFFKDDRGPAPILVLKEESIKSMAQLLEENTVESLELFWCHNSKDGIASLPSLPQTIKHLTIHNMDTVFRAQVPRHINLNQHHWIHTVIDRVGSLQKLTLVNCAAVSSELLALKEVWALKIIVEYSKRTVNTAEYQWL